MTKRLIAVLAVAFVAMFVTGAYAEVQNMKVGGDITVMGIMRELNLNNGQAGTLSNDKHQSIASATRVRLDADLTDNVMATVRLINERYWESQGETTSNTDIDLDLAMVTLKEFLYSPLTAVVGRQEIKFGNGMVVGDARPDSTIVGSFGSDPDLSMRKAFDALRFILNYDPLVVDVIASKITESTTAVDNDVDLYGVNAAMDVNDVIAVEGYWFEKHSQKKVTANNKTDRVDTIGTHVTLKPADTIIVSLEGAFQFGTGVQTAINNTAKRRAAAFEAGIGITPKDVKYSPTLMALYAFFSGQKSNDVKTISAWDPMFEDQKYGDIANAQFPQSNAHILGLVGTITPAEDVMLKAEYYAFIWDKRYGNGQTITTVRGDSLIMEHNKFAGQEIDLTATYNYTEDVAFSLLSGIFFPGSSFSGRNDNVATELIGKMKVAF